MKILLIDDDVGCLKSLGSLLTKAGYVCDECSDPEEALAVFQQKTHDAVLTDMRMPGIDGIQVLKRVRSLRADTKVIIITGYGDVETAIAAVNHGAYAFLGKPLEIDDLMETLEKAEQDIRQQEKIRNEHARLALEYARLKRAFEDLQALMRSKLDIRGGNS